MIRPREEPAPCVSCDTLQSRLAASDARCKALECQKKALQQVNKEAEARCTELEGMVLWAVMEFRVWGMPMEALKLLNWCELRENVKKDAEASK